MAEEDRSWEGPAGYADWLADLKGRIRQARLRASLSVNHELLLLYWQIGTEILERQNLRGWGARVIDRLAAYAEAGADCLYAPGLKTAEDIAAVVKAVHPMPVNLLIGAFGLSVAQVADLGVRRISVGGSLARTAWAGFMRSAREMAEQGTFTELANGFPGGELNKMFG